MEGNTKGGGGEGSEGWIEAGRGRQHSQRLRGREEKRWGIEKVGDIVPRHSVHTGRTQHAHQHCGTGPHNQTKTQKTRGK